ncbi:MAG: PHP domain-containing protein [Christensenellales bacterium]
MNYNELNKMVKENELFRYKIPSHINLLVKNKIGLKNFYKIISESRIRLTFKKMLELWKSLIENNREGILVGSGCGNGEIFRIALEKTVRQLRSD